MLQEKVTAAKLFNVVSVGNLEKVKELSEEVKSTSEFQFRISRNIKSQLGRTVLHAAAITGRPDILEYLLRRLSSGSLDLGFRDFYGWTPLHYAAGEGHLHCAELLLELGGGAIEVNCKNNSGGTPFHKAADNGHVDCAELLNKYGADVNQQDEWWGRTPLHNAICRGRTGFVKFLLENTEADPNIQCFEGLTAFEMAMKEGNKDIQKLLTGHCSKYNMMACESGQTSETDKKKSEILPFVENVLLEVDDENTKTLLDEEIKKKRHPNNVQDGLINENQIAWEVRKIYHEHQYCNINSLH